MQFISNNTKKKQKAFLQRKNQELKEFSVINRKDFKKKNELREQRLNKINAYRDEQVAALKR